MTIREKALQVIEELPEDTNLVQIFRELSYFAGLEQAREEIQAGQGMNAEEAKVKLREWISK